MQGVRSMSRSVTLQRRSQKIRVESLGGEHEYCIRETELFVRGCPDIAYRLSAIRAALQTQFPDEEILDHTVVNFLKREKLIPSWIDSVSGPLQTLGIEKRWRSFRISNS